MVLFGKYVLDVVEAYTKIVCYVVVGTIFILKMIYKSRSYQKKKSLRNKQSNCI